MAISLNCSVLEKLGGIKCPQDDPNLKGLSRYFNSKTMRGRANTSKASLGVIILGVLICYQKSLFSSKEKK